MDANTIAKRFATGVRDLCTDEQWAEIRRRNVTYPEGVCASHDFYDANMVMLEAFDSDVWGADGSHMREDARLLWNEAWAIAKRDYLTGDA